MELTDYRKQLDEIDDRLLQLFLQRMEISADIAFLKQKNNLPVLDAKREREKLLSIRDQAPAEYSEYAVSLFSTIMELSRSSQNRILNRKTTVTKEIEEAIRSTPQLFPQSATVACQGVEGAYSSIASEKLFSLPNIFYFSTFEAVFNAIEKGLCRYGVIPVENSTAGSVNAVYDLMLHHDFRIVRSVRIKVDHNLLVKPGTKMGDIREIYSHGQAISQCRTFLSSLSNVKVIPCENTAVAAKMVADSDDCHLAALSSRSCMDLYGLSCLRSSVQDHDNNYTRFICISKDLEIYPGADRTSLMITLPHKQGSLYHVISRFHALGINMNKLESRPIPERDFEFMFYFDLDSPVYSPKFIQLMGELDSVTEKYQYLGSYSEVI